MYIVNNCPCFIDFDEQSLFDNLCKNGGNCPDCTSCTTKKIIEKCKEIIREAKNNSLYKSEYGDIIYFEQQGMKKLAEHILDIYDIQEI